MIYYTDLQIVLQEVPGQISLCVSVTGCPLRCKGCHSPFLWKKGTGTPLTDEVFITTLERYKDMISCVLSSGANGERQDLSTNLQLPVPMGCIPVSIQDLQKRRYLRLSNRNLLGLKQALGLRL